MGTITIPKRETLSAVTLLLGFGAILTLGWNQLPASEYTTWGLTFGGTTAIAVLLVSLYRVQQELQASRRDLAQQEAELAFALEVQQFLLPQKFPSERT